MWTHGYYNLKYNVFETIVCFLTVGYPVTQAKPENIYIYIYPSNIN